MESSKISCFFNSTCYTLGMWPLWLEQNYMEGRLSAWGQ